jgi:betaine-aldehyde dehydrogenase
MASTEADTTLAADRAGVFVDNAWTTSSSPSWLEIVDPSTEQVVARVPAATNEDVDAAVASARRAFDEGPWPRLTPGERADVLERIADGIDAHAQELAELTTAEVGVPISQSGLHAAMAAGMFRYYAALARSHPFREDRARPDGGTTRVLQEPVGVVAAIVPWNGPVAVAGMKLAPALAAGCTAILKPPPNTPLGVYRLADIFAEAGLPDGVVNVLVADREASHHLAAHPGVDKITFTGSTAVGKDIMATASARLARVTLELGGKSAAIVGDDLPLDAILPSLVAGGCGNTGQACFGLTRVLVSEDRHDELVAGMVAAYQGLKVGDAHDPETEMGPLASRAQLERVTGYIELARQEGATIATGGGRPAGLDHGYFVEPTLLTDVDNGMRIAQEEIFGPVVCVIRYRDLDEAVRIANESMYGLGGSVYMADQEQAFEVARRVRTGMISLNTFHFDPTMPFGGVKCSGQGRECGEEGIVPFLEIKSVHLLPAGA